MTKVRKNSWYSEADCQQLQIRLYALFVEKKGVPLQTLKDCIKEFAANNPIEKRKKVKSAEGKELVSILDWLGDWKSDFFKLVSERSGISFRRREYHDDFNERQMDGSLAYNGVTDDF